MIKGCECAGLITFLNYSELRSIELVPFNFLSA
jgi:hypothetical protein